MSKQETTTIAVMGMVRDFLADYNSTIDSVPDAWSESTDSPKGRKVTVTKAQAKEMSSYLMAARTWALEAGSFVNPQRKSNATRHALRIAKEFGAFAGVEVETPTRAKKGKQVADESIDLPTEPVTDLEPGDEIIVVRQVTRYGLNVIDRYNGKVTGKTKKGDYWVSDEDGANRAARPTEVILVKRASEVAKDETKKPRAKKKAEAVTA